MVDPILKRMNIPTMKIIRGNTYQRDPSANTGHIRYNTDYGEVEICHQDHLGNAIWKSLVQNIPYNDLSAISFTTDNDTEPLKIESTIIDVSGSGALTISHNNRIRLTINDAVSTSSDDRLKHNEEIIPNSLDLIDQLKPYKYQKTDKMYDAGYNGIISDKWVWEIGLIAQDVSKIPYFNFMVNKMPNDGMYTLSYLNFLGLLVQGTKDLYNENKSLKKDIVSCKKHTHDVSYSFLATIEELNNKVEALESRVLALEN